MPIRFEQAAPMDSGAAMGSGRAQVMTANNSTLAGLMRAVADAYQSRNQIAGQMAIQDMRNRQSGAEMAFQQQQASARQRDALAQADSEASLRYGAAVEQEQIQAAAMLARQTQEFTQSDKIRLEKLQAARSWVESYSAQNNLSKEDTDQLMAQVAMGEAPIKIREARSRERLVKEQEQLTMTKASMAGRAMVFQQEVQTKGLDKYTSPEYDRKTWIEVEDELKKRPGFAAMPEANRQDEITKEVTRRGGYLGRWVPTANGMTFEEAPRGGEKSAAPLSEKSRLDLWERVVKESEQLGREKDGAPIKGEAEWWDENGGIRREQWRQAEYQKRSTIPGGEKGGPGKPQVVNSPAGAPAEQPPASQPAAQQRPVEVPIGKPFEDVAKAEPLQKAAMGLWDKFAAAAQASTVDDEAAKKSYLDHVQWAKSMLGKYGDSRAMPPEIRQRYDAIINAMTPLLMKPAQPAPQEFTPSEGIPLG